MDTSIFPIAEALAADLAGARVDVSEAQKALAYLRSKRESRALFDYLRTVVAEGRAVIRSRQTLDYYRELQAACERHLRPLQGDYERLILAYAWSLRLLRYYRTVPEAAPEKAAQQRQGGDAAAARPAASQPTPQPKQPTLPTAGAMFTGKIIAADESAVAIEVPGFDTDTAIGRIKAENLGGKQFKEGNSARVEVVDVRKLKDGRTLIELKPAPPKKKE